MLLYITVRRKLCPGGWHLRLRTRAILRSIEKYVLRIFRQCGESLGLHRGGEGGVDGGVDEDRGGLAVEDRAAVGLEKGGDGPHIEHRDGDEPNPPK